MPQKNPPENSDIPDSMNELFEFLSGVCEPKSSNKDLTLFKEEVVQIMSESSESSSSSPSTKAPSPQKESKPPPSQNPLEKLETELAKTKKSQAKLLENYHKLGQAINDTRSKLHKAQQSSNEVLTGKVQRLLDALRSKRDELKKALKDKVSRIHRITDAIKEKS